MELNGLDKFKLITYHNLDIDERNVLTLLYQPIIGCDAFTLYLTLWSLIERSKVRSPEFLHFKLYDILRITPKQFLTARQKLEGIGLIVTYHKEDIYLYELKAPLTAQEFIKDGSLGAYLLSRVGAENFEELISLFRLSKDEKDGFKNITINFNDVFQAIPKQVSTKGNFVSKTKAKININHSFDFDVFLDGLSKNFVDRRKITKSIKEKIMNLSYVYNLDEFTMQKVFMDSVDKDRNINIDKLSYNAKTWFEFERGPEKIEEQVQTKKVVSHLDMIEKCKTSSHLEILGILSNGKPAVSEVNVVEKLFDNFDLPSEVINFLLVYVVSRLNNFPSYQYFDKIAVSWQRADVKKVEDAINVVKQFERQFTEGSTTTKKSTYQKNTIPNDIEVDWFEEYLKNR